MSPPVPSVNNTATIARNSFWYGLEQAFGTFAAVVTSIVIARSIGPTKQLDYFNYIAWLTTVTMAVGSFGLPITTRKYMAEYLNSGEEGIAHAIYRRGLKLQMMIAAVAAALGMVLVWFAGDRSQRLVSLLLVSNMFPRLVLLIPSQANNASERFRLNTQPALTGGLIGVALTWFSLWIGWGLPGVAASLGVSATVETFLKMRLVKRWLRAPAGAISVELRKRMLSFSGQGLTLMILNMLVWDKSDLFILRALNHIPGQVTFFTLSFNLTERMMMIPNGFAAPLGATIMAQYGRGRERLNDMAISGAKYSFLLVLPLLAGMAGICRPLILTAYGRAFEPMIPVLAVAALLAVPKAMMAVPTVLLQTSERQHILIWVGCTCGALDVLLDVLLTPKYGALGAAIANGSAQTAAAIVIWYQVRRLFKIDLRLGEFGRILVCGLCMGATVVSLGLVLHGAAALAICVPAGALVWLAMVRVMRVIHAEDRGRLLQVSGVFPGPFRKGYQRVVALLAR